MSKLKQPDKDLSTEDKIKRAARKVFIEKGYAAARTRDIAEASGINLALLNYYFRSKEKLFHIIMMETVQEFLLTVKEIVNVSETTLEQKLASIVSNYIDLLIKEPNFPIFILSEVQLHPDQLLKKTGIMNFMGKSVFSNQLAEHFKRSKTQINPIHFLINFAGLTVFPFVAKPMIKTIATINDKAFNQLMLERKQLIPEWVSMMLKMKY